MRYLLSILRTRLLLTGFLLAVAFLATPVPVQADEEPVCAIGATQYDTLDAALAAISEGESETIRLLKNINYAGTMTITGKTVTFDLNGYELLVSNVLGNGLEVNGGVVNVVDTAGTGGFVAIGSGNPGHGVIAANGGQATVTDVIGSNFGVKAMGTGSFVHVKGNVSATNSAGFAVEVEDGGAVQVDGNIISHNSWYGATAYGNGSSIVVNGSVTAQNEGVHAYIGSTITVNGNVTVTNSGAEGAIAEDSGSTVWVMGNITANSDFSTGVISDNGGMVTVDGTISAPTYIQLGTVNKTPADFVQGTGSDAHYKVYTDGTNTVRVLNNAPISKGTVPTQTVIAGGSAAAFSASDIAVDADGDSLTITAIVTPPASGTATASLDSGTVTLTGVAAGDTSVVVTVSDGIDTADITVPVTVTAAPVPPTITIASLPDGTVNTAYSQALTATGDAPIAWSLDSGSLPTGLTLSNGGVISGTPTAAGTFNFTVKADNSAGSDTKALSITISPAPVAPVITTQPINQTVTAGETATFTVTATGDAPLSYRWKKDGNNLSDGGSISGAATATLTISNAQASDAGSYTCYVSNAAGGVTSDAATLTVNPAVIDIAAIPGVTPPARGAAPVTAITETAQYTGTVSWSPADNPFGSGTVYTATITLTPKAGYTLTGVAANFFTVAGATSASNAADSGVVTAVFPATEAEPLSNNPPAAKNPVPTQSVTAGDTAAFTAYDIAEDVDNDTLTITAIVTGPASGTATANLDSGTVTLNGVAAGSTSVVVTVYDGTDTADVTVPVVVTAAPPITYTVSFDSQGGSSVASITGVAAGSVVTAPSSPTRTGYTFGGWYKEASCVNAWNFSVDTVTANITLYARWTYNGGGGGGGSISNTPATPTYKATVSGNNISETKLPVRVNTNTDSAATDLGTLAKDIFAGTGTAVLTVPSIPGVNSYTLGIPAASLSGSQGEGALTFSTGAGSITIPSGMLAGIPGTEGKEAGITIARGDKSGLPEEVKAAIGDRPVVQLTLTLDGEQTEWNNPDAPVTVSIPYTPTEAELADPEHIVVWYIDGSGNVVSVPNGRYDPATGTVTFTTTHFSYYAITYVHKTFGDLGGVEWARKPVEVMASKGIISGTGKDTFSPAANITRADYLVLLVKTMGLTAEFNGSFDDVEPGAYYYEAVGVAKKLGIAVGSGNNRFNPKENISRQNMMALTARALEKYKGLKAAGGSTVLDKFRDKGDIAGYAAGSLATLVKEGLITGSGDRLNPRANTTRAEAAAFLYKIYNKYSKPR